MRFLGPCILDGLQLRAALASLLRSIHEVAERLDGGVCYTQDVVVVTRVDGRCDQGSSFRVSTGDGQEITAHDIGLGSNGDQAVDVLADRYQDLACHVSALLCSWSLVFDVNTRCTLLDKQLCELHDGCQTSMSGIRIGDDWP